MNFKNIGKPDFQLWLCVILFSVFSTDRTLAQSPYMSTDEAAIICSEHSGPQLGVCAFCVQNSEAMKSSQACKDYLPLMNAQALVEAPAAIEAIDPAEMEAEVEMIRGRCDRVEQLNCQCWEKEYRDNRANGLEVEAAATEISSACVSPERIKAFEYPRCVIQSKQWIKIVEFESYCGCVADYIATKTKLDWSVAGTSTPWSRFLSRDAAEKCGYGQQERLSPDAANERYAEYGRRGPSLDPVAWKKVP